MYRLPVKTDVSLLNWTCRRGRRVLRELGNYHTFEVHLNVRFTRAEVHIVPKKAKASWKIEETLRRLWWDTVAETGERIVFRSGVELSSMYTQVYCPPPPESRRPTFEADWAYVHLVYPRIMLTVLRELDDRLVVLVNSVERLFTLG